MNNLVTEKENSNLQDDANKNQIDKTHNTNIINNIIDKNMDTFLASIEFAHKFYSDVMQSYYNYIMTIKKSSKKSQLFDNY